MGSQVQLGWLAQEKLPHDAEPKQYTTYVQPQSAHAISKPEQSPPPEQLPEALSQLHPQLFVQKSNIPLHDTGLPSQCPPPP
jgi:hypothetical protein